MLVLGLVGISDEEAKSHFSMWAIRGAPLLIGADIRPPHERSFGPIPRLTIRDLEILKNKEVIDVDQDLLGASGRVISRDQDGMEVDAKALGTFASGEYAVLLLNRSSRAHNITVTWRSLGLQPTMANVRDLWKHADLGSFAGQFTAFHIPPHGVRMLRVKGVVDWSLPRDYEAEWAYNTVAGTAHTRCVRPGRGKLSSTCVVDGIGGGSGNSLQFNELWEGAEGSYRLRIRYAAAESRQARIIVNHQSPIVLSFPATGGTSKCGTVQLHVTLDAGKNSILVENSSGLAPSIDKISILSWTVAHPKTHRRQ